MAASIGLAWLSTVIHQFDDPARCRSASCGRVVGPVDTCWCGGSSPTYPSPASWSRFPGIERSVATFPSTAEVDATFSAAGFDSVRQVDVVEPWTFPLDTWPDRVRTMHPADSGLRPLTVDEIEAGIETVLDRFSGQEGPAPSPGTLRLLVFRRP